VEVVLRGIAFIGFLFATTTATAATVRGTVMLPPEPRVADHDAHWRVENGVLAVGPRVPDPRLDVLVVLEGAAGAKGPALPNATVGLHGLRLDPRVSVIPVGGSVEFKNDDRVPHTLYVEKATTLMPATPTPAGQARAQKFYAAGEYRVRDEEYPHIDGTIVVVATPFVARLDDKGTFKIEAPEGKYTLKVWYHDRWAVTQAIEVTGRASEVNVQVPAAAAAPAPAAPAAAPATGAKP
jgi:plastocyanin